MVVTLHGLFRPGILRVVVALGFTCGTSTGSTETIYFAHVSLRIFVVQVMIVPDYLLHLANYPFRTLGFSMRRDFQSM